VRTHSLTFEANINWLLFKLSYLWSDIVIILAPLCHSKPVWFSFGTHSFFMSFHTMKFTPHWPSLFVQKQLKQFSTYQVDITILIKLWYQSFCCSSRYWESSQYLQCAFATLSIVASVGFSWLWHCKPNNSLITVSFSYPISTCIAVIGVVFVAPVHKPAEFSFSRN